MLPQGEVRGHVRHSSLHDQGVACAVYETRRRINHSASLFLPGIKHRMLQSWGLGGEAGGSSTAKPLRCSKPTISTVAISPKL